MLLGMAVARCFYSGTVFHRVSARVWQLGQFWSATQPLLGKCHRSSKIESCARMLSFSTLISIGTFVRPPFPSCLLTRYLFLGTHVFLGEAVRLDSGCVWYVRISTAVWGVVLKFCVVIEQGIVLKLFTCAFWAFHWSKLGAMYLFFE